ncbi:hypothetical protein [Fusobacterium varium]|uniref:hypothetical protein n=1 Tax=Fusobacterium varium TaxID=856 RepID=UPI00302A0FDE
MGSSLDSNSVSGIYTCYCGNLETHINGKSKAPCSSCKRNSSWTLLVETEELEKALKSTTSYLETESLGRIIAYRFKNKTL